VARWLTPELHAVVFDAVGTLLFPSIPAPQVYAEVARRNGLDLNPDMVRSRFLEAYQAQEMIDQAAGWVTSEQREHERWYQIVSAVFSGMLDQEQCFHTLFEHFAQPSAWRLHPDTQEVIAQLSTRGYRLGIGSNYDERLLSVLAGFPELDPLRQQVIISSLVGVRKPAAGFFQAVGRRMGYPPHQILFVGDDLVNDYFGAREAGLQAVLLDEAKQAPTGVQRIRRLSELLH
jgi:putative hydrolase of the HAD superfamily